MSRLDRDFSFDLQISGVNISIQRWNQLLKNRNFSQENFRDLPIKHVNSIENQYSICCILTYTQNVSETYLIWSKISIKRNQKLLNTKIFDFAKLIPKLGRRTL